MTSETRGGEAGLQNGVSARVSEDLCAVRTVDAAAQAGAEVRADRDRAGGAPGVRHLQLLRHAEQAGRCSPTRSAPVSSRSAPWSSCWPRSARPAARQPMATHPAFRTCRRSSTESTPCCRRPVGPLQRRRSRGRRVKTEDHERGRAHALDRTPCVHRLGRGQRRHGRADQRGCGQVESDARPGPRRLLLAGLVQRQDPDADRQRGHGRRISRQSTRALIRTRSRFSTARSDRRSRACGPTSRRRSRPPLTRPSAPLSAGPLAALTRSVEVETAALTQGERDRRGAAVERRPSEPQRCPGLEPRAGSAARSPAGHAHRRVHRQRALRRERSPFSP